MKTLTNTEIAASVLERDGGSYYLLGGKLVPVERRDGDVYSVGGAYNRFGESITALELDRESFDAEAVRQSIEYVANQRRGATGNWDGVGFWISDDYPDIVFVDAIDLIMGKQLAMQIGRDRCELAIYSLQRDEVISL